MAVRITHCWTHEVLPAEGAGDRRRAEGDAALLVGAVVEAGVRLGRAPRGLGLRPRRVPHAARPSCAATRPRLRRGADTRWARDGGVGAGSGGV